MALPDYSKLVGGDARTSGISLASISTGANYLGSEINNAANLDEFADIEVVWSFGTNPTAGQPLKVYILYAFDGSNYEDGAGVGTGSGDVDPFPHSLVDTIGVLADTGTHRVLLRDIPLEPYKFKVLVMNDATGQTATVTVNVITRRGSQIVD